MSVVLKNVTLAFFVLPFVIYNFIALESKPGRVEITGAPPYGEAESEVPDSGPLAGLAGWKRPEGGAKVGIQVGHWKNNEVPEELERLKNNTGARGGGKWEWEVNYEIASQIAKLLRDEKVAADILPATVPAGYWADVFIAIHADGSEDRSKSGYKFAGPWRDYTRRSARLVETLQRHYEEATGLAKDENITRNMRGYYAFSWWRYRHAVHPMTTAVIAETGFLTNDNDRKLLLNTPEIPAGAMAKAILEYLEGENLIEK